MNVCAKASVFFCSMLYFCSAEAGQSAMQKMLNPVIEHQCVLELKDSNLWKASTFLMTAGDKRQFEQDVCSCVSANALNDVPASELAHAAVSAEAKNQLIKTAVLNTVKSCVIQQKK